MDLDLTAAELAKLQDDAGWQAIDTEPRVRECANQFNELRGSEAYTRSAERFRNHSRGGGV